MTIDRAAKGSELDRVVSIAANSLLFAVTGPDTANANTVMITFGDLTNTISSNSVSSNVVLITSNTTPVSNSESTPGRKIWFDDNYLYVAVANNSLKRIPLQNF